MQLILRDPITNSGLHHFDVSYTHPRLRSRPQVDGRQLTRPLLAGDWWRLKLLPPSSERCGAFPLRFPSPVAGTMWEFSRSRLRRPTGWCLRRRLHLSRLRHNKLSPLRTTSSDQLSPTPLRCITPRSYSSTRTGQLDSRIRWPGSRADKEVTRSGRRGELRTSELPSGRMTSIY